MTGSRKYNFKCQSFPNTIEQERRRRGWTVTKLAELSGVSRYSITAYETWAAHCRGLFEAIGSFFDDPDNQAKFEAWHKKKYGCLPKDTSYGRPSEAKGA